VKSATYAPGDPEAGGFRLPVASCQLPVVSCQLSVVSCQLSVCWWKQKGRLGWSRAAFLLLTNLSNSILAEWVELMCTGMWLVLLGLEDFS
jgi:hypothetical protein